MCSFKGRVALAFPAGIHTEIELDSGRHHYRRISQQDGSSAGQAASVVHPRNVTEAITDLQRREMRPQDA